MLDDSTVSLLQSGSALIVGLVSADGEPVASRAWGLRIDGLTLRAMLGSHDVGIAQTSVGSTFAVTGADVATFRSTQVKGTVVSVEAPTEDDLAMSRAYIDAYFGAISRGDATERALLARMDPGDVLAVTVAITGAFDQTPGPDAGSTLEAPR